MQALEGAGGLCASTQALKRGQAERPAEERLVDLSRGLDEFGVPLRDGLLDLVGGGYEDGAHGAQLTSSRGWYSIAQPALLVLPSDAASPHTAAIGLQPAAHPNRLRDRREFGGCGRCRRRRGGARDQLEGHEGFIGGGRMLPAQAEAARRAKPNRA